MLLAVRCPAGSRWTHCVWEIGWEVLLSSLDCRVDQVARCSCHAQLETCYNQASSHGKEKVWLYVRGGVVMSVYVNVGVDGEMGESIVVSMKWQRLCSWVSTYKRLKYKTRCISATYYTSPRALLRPKTRIVHATTIFLIIIFHNSRILPTPPSPSMPSSEPPWANGRRE